MRNNEERIAAMHSRAAHLKQKRNTQMFGVVSVALFVVLLMVLIPLADLSETAEIPSGMNASIFYQGDHLGLIVIAIISFLSGVSFTISCFYLKKTSQGDDR